MTQVLNGHHLFLAFHKGAQAVLHQKDAINRMNVFPVPDGDTGSNLSSTMRSGMENAERQDSFGKTLASIAKHTLLGARGNSGLLFAQFISGLAEAVGDQARIEKEAFSKAVSKAVKSAYASISTPIEGTMLTVMREWSEALEAEHPRCSDIIALLSNTLEKAAKSLNSTKEKLAVLKKAKLQDAGAKGFVDFLNAFVERLKQVAHLSQQELSETLTGQEDEISLEIEEEIDAHNFDLEGGISSIPFRFCTEGIVKNLANPCLEEIRTALSPEGDCLIVAGGSQVVRIHIHTNSPQKVFKILQGFGLVDQQKADDMHLQYLIASRQEGAERKKIALLTDTTCDIPDELLLKHRITMVPLTVHFGEQSWLDRFSLTADRFYELLEQEKEFPKTSQPNPAIIKRNYQYLLSHFDQVFAAHISDGLSGTGANSRNEAKNLDPERIHVFESKETSISLGLSLLRASEDLENDCRPEDLKVLLQRYLDTVRFKVLVPKLDNFVRGGRVSKQQALIARLLNIKPIVSTDPEGKGAVVAKAWGEQGALNHIISDIKNTMKSGPIHSWALAHAKSEAKAQKIAASLEKIIGKAPAFIGPVSPVLGAHGGPGAINIAWLPE